MGITSETSMVNGWTLNGEVCLGVQSAGVNIVRNAGEKIDGLHLS